MKKKKALASADAKVVQLAGRAFEWELPKSIAERQLLVLTVMSGVDRESASCNAVTLSAVLGLCVPRLRKVVPKKFKGDVESYGMAVMEFLFDEQESEPVGWDELRTAADQIIVELVRNIYKPKEVEEAKDFSEPPEAS
jgi:hypothetical protein